MMETKLYAIVRPDGTEIARVRGKWLYHGCGKTIVCNNGPDSDSVASIPNESGCIVYEVQEQSGEANEKDKGE